MTPFEYAQPTTEGQVVELLHESAEDSVVLAGGTHLVDLMRENVLRPRRVVNLQDVASLRSIEVQPQQVVVGALTTLSDLAQHPVLADFRSLHDVIDGIRAIQVQQNGTLGGDLCVLPNCWYFRSGYGLLALQNGESLPELGDNRYHAIFGNAGPAKFVSASRFAPGLIALNASVRVIGPQPELETVVPLANFYQTPASESDRHVRLLPGQIISHIIIPTERQHTATYEVLESEGLDWPQAAAAVSLSMEKGRVQTARIVLGHVAPEPWEVAEAAASLLGYPVNQDTASRAAELAVSGATPLSMNAYKVHMAQTCVERALLRAVDKLRLS